MAVSVNRIRQRFSVIHSFLIHEFKIYLQGRKDCGCPRIGGFLVGGKVVGYHTIVGNKRKPLGSNHGRRFHGQSQCLCQFSGSIRQETDACLVATRSSAPCYFVKINNNNINNND